MSIFDYEVTAQDGTKTSLKEYEGKVCLVVNTATGCGFTPQYEELEDIYAKYREQGFEVLDFPCNQFANQAPESDEEIKEFCTLKFGTEFPQFAKGDVNGENANPVFVELSTALPHEGFGKGPKALMMKGVAKTVDAEHGDKAYIKWNFTKFLVGRDGTPIARFEPTEDMKKVEEAVAAAL